MTKKLNKKQQLFFLFWHFTVTMCDPNITIIIMTSDINSIYYHNSKYILKASTEYKK